MLRIGLTGGIGSGKTTASRIFTALRIPVYNSDDRAKSIMITDNSVVSEIKSFLGEEAYSNGGINRKYIASRVFTDRSLLEKLNATVHPAVMRDFVRWCELHEKCLVPYVVQENAILFEGGFDKEMDYSVTVSTPEEERIARAVERDWSSIKKIKDRIDNQMTDPAREKLADFILRNAETDLLLPQVISLHNKLTALTHNNTND